MDSRTFQVPYDGPHGKTLEYDEPKREALKYQWYVSLVLGRCYTATYHADGHITVAGDGLEPMTFASA